MAEPLYHAYGGASIPLPNYALNVSWPLAQLDITAVGLDIRVSPSWLAFFGSQGATPINSWSLSWPDVRLVFVAHRSIFIDPVAGRGCRFVTLTAGRLRAIVALIEAHEVPTERALTTIGKAFRI